jgi:hypothetical protein
MMLKRTGLALGTLLLLAVTACSADVPSTKTTESPAASDTGPQTTATPGGATPASSSAGTTPGSVTPASSCLTGRYRLARFVAVGGNATYGTGEGGDVIVTFGPGTYELKGAGKKPVTVTLAGQQASLLVAGTIRGDYHSDGDKADFTIRHATGTGTLTAGRQTRTLTMHDLANVLGLTGSGTLACSPGLLVVTMDNVRLEFEKA